MLSGASYARSCFSRLLQVFFLFLECCLGGYDSAHYNLDYPYCRSSFTGSCHDCAQSTLTMPKPSLEKDVRNTVGGKL